MDANHLHGVISPMQTWTVSPCQSRFENGFIHGHTLQWLVVYLPLSKIWTSIGMIIPNIYIYMERQKRSKPPTRWSYPPCLEVSWKQRRPRGGPGAPDLDRLRGCHRGWHGHCFSSLDRRQIRCFIMFRTPDAPDSSGFVHWTWWFSIVFGMFTKGNISQMLHGAGIFIYIWAINMEFWCR